MVHRSVGGIAAVLLLLASCGESAPPQAAAGDLPVVRRSVPGDDRRGERDRHDRPSGPSASSRSRRPRPRCCSRSGRRPGGGGRRPVELPGRCADHRSVGVRAERRGDRLVRARSRRLRDRAGRPRRLARRASASRRLQQDAAAIRSTTCTTRSISSGRPRGTRPRRRPSRGDASGDRRRSSSRSSRPTRR